MNYLQDFVFGVCVLQPRNYGSNFRGPMSSLSRTQAGLASDYRLKVPGLTPDKGHVFLVSIVNDESSNVHAKIFSDIHFGAKSLEC